MYLDLNFMMGGMIQIKSIRDNCDALLRLVSSVRHGTVTASLIFKKLSSYPRQNSLGSVAKFEKSINRLIYEEQYLGSS